MTRAAQRASPALLQLAAVILVSGGITVAENIDPLNDDSKYAYGENLGWINAQPLGPGGSGVEVSDSSLTGWAWSENAGWISLSCTNTSCGLVSFGVTNNGCGTLGGYAWSENLGWIGFAPSTCGGDPTCGVKISPTTGIFSGRAWSENAGWMTFSSSGPSPYRVATSWRGPVPVGDTTLTLGNKSGSNVDLTWTLLSSAAQYDVVYGDLNLLRSANGNVFLAFQVSTLGCLAHATAGSPFTQTGNPSAGNGYWFLVRGRNCGGIGTYGHATAGPRDPGITASGHDCN
jgi:hypothetical protein